MNYQSLLFILSLTQIISCAPIVVTRMHTAEAVTVTNTYTTITNTHTAAPVQILVSDGVSYTFTLTDQATLEKPYTFTSIVNKAATPTAVDNGNTITNAANTVQANTVQATTTLAPSDNNQNIQAGTTGANNANNQNTQATTTAVNNGNGNVQAIQNTQTFSTTAVNNGNGNVQTTQNQNTQNAQVDEDSNQTTHEAPTALASVVATPSNTAVTTTLTSPSTTSTQASNKSGKLTSKPTAIVYSPYNNDNTCKDFNTVNKDLNYIKSLGISKIRIYGTDCNSVQNVETVAKNIGLKINQGFWISQDGPDSIDDGVDTLIAWGKTNGWDVIDFITVGNEAIQFNYITVDQLLNKVSDVRSKLRAAGYNGKITTSEPPHMFVENPKLCTSGVLDFVGVNPHSYFDPYSSAATSGSFVKGQVDLVKQACGNIDILVTETGYPSAGRQNGGNVPSKANQLVAVQSILDELDCEVTILSIFDDYWKDPGPYGIEQSFGIWDLLE